MTAFSIQERCYDGVIRSSDLCGGGTLRWHYTRRRRAEYRPVERHQSRTRSRDGGRRTPFRATCAGHDIDRCGQTSVAVCATPQRLIEGGPVRGPGRQCSQGAAGDRLDGNDSGSTATVLSFSGRSADPANKTDGDVDRGDGAFVAGPINHPDLITTQVFNEELVLLSAHRWKTFAALRAGTPASGPTILVFRTGCSYRQRLEQLMSEFGWPSAARLEFGTLDGIIGCVAAGMGVTLLPRAVVERSELSGAVRVHALRSEQRRIDTLFIHRRTIHESCALRSFLSCLKNGKVHLAA